MLCLWDGLMIVFFARWRNSSHLKTLRLMFYSSLTTRLDIRLVLKRPIPTLKSFFFTPNTTSLMQLLYQGIIAAFKTYYTRRFFKRILKSIEENSEVTVTSSWKKFNIADCITKIDASLIKLNECSINVFWRNIWPPVV